MTEKNFGQTQTAVNSPLRRSQDKNGQFHLFTHRPFPQKMSQTQKAIYSHELIRDLMQARTALLSQGNKKSLNHKVNHIDHQISLSARPIHKHQDEFKFNSIPPEDKMYSSHCYGKINDIKQGLRDSKNGKDKVDDSKKGTKSRPLSAASKVNTYNPKISVNGLVNYNFKTVNARKSLGFSKVNHEEKLIEKLIDMKRRDKIMGKSSGARFLKYKQNQQVILKDFTSETDSYLAQVLEKDQQNTLIYNERAKKLNFIKEYMEQEGVNYEEAASIVTQIEGSKKKKEPKGEVKKKGDPNDEALLQGRRIPMQRKPLFVRQFLFIE